MSLIAKTDVTKFLKLKDVDPNGAYKKLARKCLGKLEKVWAKQNTSTNAAETIKKICGEYFVTPNKTRWNSLRDSMKRADRLLCASKDRLRSLFNKLDVPPLTENEALFI